MNTMNQITIIRLNDNDAETHYTPLTDPCC